MDTDGNTKLRAPNSREAPTLKLQRWPEVAAWRVPPLQFRAFVICVHLCLSVVGLFLYVSWYSGVLITRRMALRMTWSSSSDLESKDSRKADSCLGLSLDWRRRFSRAGIRASLSFLSLSVKSLSASAAPGRASRRRPSIIRFTFGWLTRMAPLAADMSPWTSVAASL